LPIFAYLLNSIFSQRVGIAIYPVVFDGIQLLICLFIPGEPETLDIHHLLAANAQCRDPLQSPGALVGFCLICEIDALLLVSGPEKRFRIFFSGNTLPYLYRNPVIAEEIDRYRNLIRTVLTEIDPSEAHICDFLISYLDPTEQ